jgi:hypothetical protein
VQNKSAMQTNNLNGKDKFILFTGWEGWRSPRSVKSKFYQRKISEKSMMKYNEKSLNIIERGLRHPSQLVS